jgi:hypothetical protein
MFVEIYFYIFAFNEELSRYIFWLEFDMGGSETVFTFTFEF